MPSAKHCLFLVGATGVGKTNMAYEVARKYHLPILSADARQCFQELNIGVARPSELILSAVAHYFIASHSVRMPMDVKLFEQYALQCLSELFQTYDVVLVVGGSGLYLRVLEEGIAEVPEIDANIQDAVQNLYAKEGLTGIITALKQEDPIFFQCGEVKNPHRALRALSVVRGTGKSICAFQAEHLKKKRPFQIQKIGLQLPREQLYAQINARTHQMIAQGLLNETKLLRPYWDLPALRSIGYTELQAYIKGNITWETAITTIQQNTRHYAKRQNTWFRKDENILWLRADASDTRARIEAQVESLLKGNKGARTEEKYRNPNVDN